MINAEKYKTAKERAEAFRAYCKSLEGKCLPDKDCDECRFSWLDLEAEYEKPLPCPFCGSLCECEDVRDHTPIDEASYSVYCQSGKCMYQSKRYPQISNAIAAHNRVAEKCGEGEE